MKRIIALLGGNAFVTSEHRLTMAGQFQFARESLTYLKPLLEKDDIQLVLTHGNGPQVGHMLIRVEEALGKAYSIPLEVCVAESQGELGYVLEQTIHNLMAEWNCTRPVATLLTQVIVDPHDSAFQEFTKPVGPAYSIVEAEELRRKGFTVREYSGLGYRRVVPSPQPVDIVEVDVIRHLLELGVLVIAAGGGGIPVAYDGGSLVGVEAVVDKDLASALLGDRLSADLLLILTGVACAYSNFGTREQSPLESLTPEEACRLLNQGHFPPGTMGPKIEAAVQFVRDSERVAIICDPPGIERALRGEAGTTVRCAAT